MLILVVRVELAAQLLAFKTHFACVIELFEQSGIGNREIP